MAEILFGSIPLILIAVLGWLFLSIFFRIVVSTNDVHIVQSSRTTTSYGKGEAAGNTYYRWPSWVPLIGVKTIQLPMSVFDVNLKDYAAYDKGRVPFSIDIMAFFRIHESNVAAQRVHTFDELILQLKGILQGAIRSILASEDIEEILEGRSKFGLLFTNAVDTQLAAWGVINVKNIELMDIRDAEQSQVIANIMAKKKSLIERESRVAVAENLRAAKEAEIVAMREVSIRQQEAEQQVGQRTAEKDKQVGIAQQQAAQFVKEEEKVTEMKAMAVLEVQQVRAAEIEKAAGVVSFERERQRVTIAAEASLAQAQLHAQGVEVEGRAKGEADKAVLLAPVNAQITLAEKIAALPEYQAYLVKIREIEKMQVVGVAQAEALKDAEIKVIANAGTVAGGVSSVMDLLTPAGGTQLAGMLEGFVQSPAGAKVVKQFINPKGGGADVHS